MPACLGPGGQERFELLQCEPAFPLAVEQLETVGRGAPEFVKRGTSVEIRVGPGDRFREI
jgi:hypothetical protein